ncbi:MAG: class I tRNA ligase family protein, partial [Bacilli bacterium]|nr:class I tRNA ligase family protein [Bacilli bacterium]
NIVPVEEPFKKLVHQGMILGSNGIKMGKRFPEYVVDPNVVVKEYGADTLRLYEMFMGPLEADKPWDAKGIEGSRKFLERIWRLYNDESKIKDSDNKNLEKLYHQTVKKVTEDYEGLKFNTAIAQMMIFINAVYKEEVFPREYAEGFIKLLNPLAPHITEEIWKEVLKHNNSLAYETWPTCDEAKTVENVITVVIQVNGKMRDKLEVKKDTPKEELEKLALASEKIKQYTAGGVKKIIVVPNKLVSIVI